MQECKISLCALPGRLCNVNRFPNTIRYDTTLGDDTCCDHGTLFVSIKCKSYTGQLAVTYKYPSSPRTWEWYSSVSSITELGGTQRVDISVLGVDAV